MSGLVQEFCNEIQCREVSPGKFVLPYKAVSMYVSNYLSICRTFTPTTSLPV